MWFYLSDEKKVNVGLSLQEERIFKCDLGRIKIQDLYIDERLVKGVDKIGPDPSRLLGLAVLGCLAASFEFCMQKKNFNLNELKDSKKIEEIKIINIDELKLKDKPICCLLYTSPSPRDRS